MFVVGGNSLLDPETLLSVNPESSKRLVIVVPWHAKGDENKTFIDAAQHYWHSEVNWRSVTSYDAVEAIISALRKLPNANRASLQQVLTKDDFSAEGATGKISFDGCDRKESFHTLLKVVSTPHGQEFVPLSRSYSP
jgi:ABC-type branched-subunit amino acid transport system substrate-binding protein